MHHREKEVILVGLPHMPAMRDAEQVDFIIAWTSAKAGE
jgi:hypothetical protein